MKVEKFDYCKQEVINIIRFDLLICQRIGYVVQNLLIDIKLFSYCLYRIFRVKLFKN